MCMHKSIVKTHQLDVQCVGQTIRSESVRRECLDEQTTDTAVSRLKSPTERWEVYIGVRHTDACPTRILSSLTNVQNVLKIHSTFKHFQRPVPDFSQCFWMIQEMCHVVQAVELWEQ